MAEVLGDVQPVGEDHPAAQETLDSVRELLEARGQVAERIREIDSQLLSTESGFLVIKPGDTVLFSSRERITAEQAKDLKTHIEEVLPGITPVVLGGLRIEGVYRGDDDG